MLTPHLPTSAHATLAALALLVTANVANAVFSTAADPFVGNSAGVDLQAPGRTLIELPGVGPGGVTLYAYNFHIGNFAYVNTQTLGYPEGTFHNEYTADFYVDFLDPLGVSTGVFANLTAGDFHVTFTKMSPPPLLSLPFQAGTFDMILDTATFSGTTSLGELVVVSLANVPTAQVVVSSGTNGYNIDYNSAFVIDGQYSLNGSDPIPVPGLRDVNGQPTDVPVAAPAALAIPGLLAMAGLRRRRAAVAAW